MIESSASATDIVASGSSGGTCSAGGPYKCKDHPMVRLFFKAGQRFTNCPAARSKNGHSTTWFIVSDGSSSGVVGGGSGGDSLEQIPADSIL